LGLVLAEIGRRSSVVVTDQEMSEAMRAEALKYGQQAQQIFDLLRGNDNARPDPRPDLRGEGRRPHPGKGQGLRQAGRQG